METQLDKYLTEVEGRVEKATKGPWQQCLASVVGADDVFVADLISEQLPGSTEPGKVNANGRFIAHSRTDVETLLKMVRLGMITARALSKTCDEFSGKNTVAKIIADQMIDLLGELNRLASGEAG